MNNNELQKSIFPLVPGEKVPAKNAVGFSDPANYEKLLSFVIYCERPYIILIL